MTTPSSLPARNLDTTPEEHLADHGELHRVFAGQKGQPAVLWSSLPFAETYSYYPSGNRAPGTSVAPSVAELRESTIGVDLLALIPSDESFYGDDDEFAADFQPYPYFLTNHEGMYVITVGVELDTTSMAAGDVMRVTFANESMSYTLTATDITNGYVWKPFRALVYLMQGGGLGPRLFAPDTAKVVYVEFEVRAIVANLATEQTPKLPLFRKGTRVQKAGTRTFSFNISGLNTAVPAEKEVSFRLLGLGATNYNAMVGEYITTMGALTENQLITVEGSVGAANGWYRLFAYHYNGGTEDYGQVSLGAVYIG